MDVDLGDFVKWFVFAAACLMASIVAGGMYGYAVK